MPFSLHYSGFIFFLAPVANDKIKKAFRTKARWPINFPNLFGKQVFVVAHTKQIWESRLQKYCKNKRQIIVFYSSRFGLIFPTMYGR